MIEVVIKISTIFVMIFIGFAASKIKVLPADSQTGLIKLILNINIPCMLICSITQNEMSGVSMIVAVKILVYSAIYFIIAALLSEIFVKALRVDEPGDKGVYKILFTCLNTGFVGFPVTKTLFGDEALFFMALHNIILNICLYSICIIQLNSGSRENVSVKKVVKSLINPCIIAALLGVLMLFAGIKVPQYIQEIIQPIGDATIPIAMIVVGLQIAEGKIRDCFADKKLLVFSVITMIIRPAIALIAAIMLSLEPIIETVIVLATAFPPVTTVSAITANEGQNYKLAANATIVMTLLSAITIPCTAVLINIFL